MRVAVGMLHQESNSFNAKMTHRTDLDVARGQNMLERWRGSGMSIGGALEVLDAAGVEVVPLLAVMGTSGGNLAPGEAKKIVEEFMERARTINMAAGNKAAGKVDAVYLDRLPHLQTASRGSKVAATAGAGEGQALTPRWAVRKISPASLYSFFLGG
jgi:microcystin degradation protein MlrC